MTGCTVKELCAAAGGTLLQQSGAVVTEVSTDSRSIPAGRCSSRWWVNGSTATTIWTRRWNAARQAA